MTSALLWYLPDTPLPTPPTPHSTAFSAAVPVSTAAPYHAWPQLQFRSEDWRIHSATPWQQMWLTLWTHALVHLSAQHLWANVLALCAAAGIGVFVRMQGAGVLALLIAWPLSALALLMWPQPLHSAGLSGIVHACTAILGVQAAISSQARGTVDMHYQHQQRALACSLFAVLLVKLVLEAAWHQPVTQDAAWGFDVLYAAHLTGALVALLICGLTYGYGHMVTKC